MGFWSRAAENILYPQSAAHAISSSPGSVVSFDAASSAEVASSNPTEKQVCHGRQFEPDLCAAYFFETYNSRSHVRITYSSLTSQCRGREFEPHQKAGLPRPRVRTGPMCCLFFETHDFRTERRNNLRQLYVPSKQCCSLSASRVRYPSSIPCRNLASNEGNGRTIPPAGRNIN